MTTPGPTNSLVDVPGIRVGQYQRVGDGWLTGTSVVLTDGGGAVAGVDVRGGGPGTRETDLMDPRNLIERVHAVCLCGGSAFGLAVADGVMRHRYAEGVGFAMGGPGEVVPIVPAAVIFDLGRGGDFSAFPDASFGEAAAGAATNAAPPLGNVGAGAGAKAGGLKGGVGSASEVLPDGTTIAALVVVNAVGSAVDPGTGAFHGASALTPGDLRGLGVDGLREAAYPLAAPSTDELDASRQAALRAPLASRGGKTLATTIGVIATDATLTKVQCTRLAGSGHDGMARALDPIHTMFDGDTLFALATADREPPGHEGFHALLTSAAHVVTRAIVRGVLSADSVDTPGGAWRSYADAFPSVLSNEASTTPQG